MPVTELFYITPFFWLILLLTTPVITMRLFALEKFTGTFETLMTTPVSDFQVVAAKFTAALRILRRDVVAACWAAFWWCVILRMRPPRWTAGWSAARSWAFYCSADCLFRWVAAPRR